MDTAQSILPTMVPVVQRMPKNGLTFGTTKKTGMCIVVSILKIVIINISIYSTSQTF